LSKKPHTATPSSRAARWSHDHIFDPATRAAEQGTRRVTLITLAMMAVEIAAGLLFNSMSLLADGLHMSSHALAIGLAAFAYAAARRYATDHRFAFGTWKIEVLAGFSSAIFLLLIALLMLIGSVERLLSPQAIAYPEAIGVAVVGLGVNLVCAWILHRAATAGVSTHHHSHSDHQARHTHSHLIDLNLKAAHVHVLADALTSLLAIVALLGGWRFGWQWLDPLMGVVGAALIARWSQGILIDTGKVLLDREMDHPVVEEIRRVLVEQFGAKSQIQDLHVWRVGRKSYACVISMSSTDTLLTPRQVRDALSVLGEVAHATVEINPEG
jgi:cation diffusion facilitator family transporter